MNKMQCNIWVKRAIPHVLLVGWMIFIFCFSAQPGEESADLSGGISYLAASIMNNIFCQGWSEGELLEVAALIDFPVRKLAHMTEFGMLALLAFWCSRTYEKLKQGKRPWVIALVLAFVYAMTDEFHQLFVPYRHGCFSDVLIDTSGAVLALLILAGILTLRKRIEMKKRKRKR